ncbi:hypothetical protein [Actinoplanes sp. NPDC051851]|uniref:hypothetical protein n=1 Tax=Actinoplanes sp. NPDC051851 TaxID=3154753 RepID=UPI0034324EB5
MPLIVVCGVWGVFWGAWGALLPAVQDRIGGTLGDLGPALVAIPVGAIPAMAFAGRLARGRERGALDVCLNMAVARADRRSFQRVHAAFPVAVVVTAPLVGVVR